MSNFSNSRSGRLYVATQSSLGAAATLTGSNCCRHTKVKLTPENPRTPRDDKTGTLSRTPGMGGYRGASVSVEMNLAANGAAGTKPDCDPFLQSLFGAAPTVVAATSVTYALADAYIPITIGHFRIPSTVQQQIAWGVAMSSLDLGFNDGVNAKLKMAGSGVYVPDSTSFSTLDASPAWPSPGGKGGLLIAAFTEPATPVTNGSAACSFAGSLTVNSNAVTTVKSGSLSFKRAVTPQRSFGTPSPTGWGLGVRDVALKFDLFDDDSAYMTDLLQHGVEDNVFGAVFVLGNIAGNIWTFTLSGLQLTPPGLDDGSGDRWVASFSDMAASVATLGLTTELSLVIT